MGWTKLIADFFSGDPDAVQAICAVLAFVIAVIGTLYVVKTFREQAKINKVQIDINKQQAELNLLAFENHRRQIRPIVNVWKIGGSEAFYFNLKNATALNLVITPASTEGITDSEIISFKHFFVNDSEVHLPIDNRRLTYETKTLMTFHFEDEDGRKYKQVLRGASNHFEIAFPELIQTNHNN